MPEGKAQKPGSGTKVSVFITCLVDLFFPEVGISMVRLLGRLGADVSFLPGQTCCGQPAFNSGYRADARVLAKRFIRVFSDAVENDSYIVSPSGSCTTMVRVFYRELLRDDPEALGALDSLEGRLFELSEFLTEVLGVEDVGAEYAGSVTYHDSCHALRELGVSDGPRRLIRAVRGVSFSEMEMCDVCCGFGGAFSVKYPEVSVSMLEEKLGSIAQTGADTLVSTDMGCLMQIGGAVKKRGLPIRVMHLAELLASDGRG